MQDKKQLAQILAFYRDAGVDVCLGETAADRLSEERAPRMAAPQREAAPMLTTAPALAAPLVPTPDAAALDARAQAAAADTLDALRKAMEQFEGCALRKTATQLVFSDGNPSARLMLVGEAPGRDEDIEGKPFVGRSGKLLDRMLAAIGLDRGSVYIANIVPWRPPGNRTPTPLETQICLPFIRRQIQLANPDVLVCLGSPSTQALLETREGITRNRGRWFDFDTGARVIKAMPTLHPAYLLRQPLQKRLVWRDLLAVKARLDETSTEK